MKAPDYTGHAGRGWQMDMSAREQRPDWAATLTSILLNCPGAHPAWQHWMCSVIHLRELPGVKSAIKRFPEATHEIMVVALDPRYELPDPDHFEQPFHYLLPLDHVVQLEVPSDAAAVQVLETMVRACCDGIMSPDSDWREAWRTQIAHLAAHQRGEHGGARTA